MDIITEGKKDSLPEASLPLGADQPPSSIKY